MTGISEETKKKIISMKKSGHSIKTISRLCSVAKSTVVYHTNKRYRTNTIRAIMDKDYKDGKHPFRKMKEEYLELRMEVEMLKLEKEFLRNNLKSAIFGENV